MNKTTPALPDFIDDLEALLGFGFELATGRAAPVNPTRAAAMEHRPAALVCRHTVSR
jgi:hypothetical protein